MEAPGCTTSWKPGTEITRMRHKTKMKRMTILTILRHGKKKETSLSDEDVKY
jgi:hypothetical protein